MLSSHPFLVLAPFHSKGPIEKSNVMHLICSSKFFGPQKKLRKRLCMFSRNGYCTVFQTPTGSQHGALIMKQDWESTELANCTSIAG